MTDFEKFEDIEDAIDKHFGDDAKPRFKERDFQEVVMEMLEVREVKSNQVRFKHFFEDEIFEPVKLPAAILSHLKRGQVFLMMIGRNAGHWETIFMSPPYR